MRPRQADQGQDDEGYHSCRRHWDAALPDHDGRLKQLLPVFDKPMIYYPLSVLMLAGIREILIISTPVTGRCSSGCLGDGSELGLHSASPSRTTRVASLTLSSSDAISSARPRRAYSGRQHFLRSRPAEQLLRASSRASGATVFGYMVNIPAAIRRDRTRRQGRAISIEEKPQHRSRTSPSPGSISTTTTWSRSPLRLKPSGRGELEITDVNRAYLERGDLFVEMLGRGYAWLDTGTHVSLLDASHFVHILNTTRSAYRVPGRNRVAARIYFVGAIRRTGTPLRQKQLR